jgi:AAA family ATP:ADP antiporter
MLHLTKNFPLKKEELAKFFCIAIMMVMIIFIYSTQRIVKDSIVVCNLGAELISTLKLWAVTPSAIIIMLFYAKLADNINKTKIFHLFNCLFVGYFLFFTFVINPNIHSFTFSLDNLKTQLPHARYFFIMLENWSYTIYYIFAELWGSVMLSLMFWQTANQVFQIKQARMIYPLLGLTGQLGMILSQHLNNKFTNIEFAATWQESLEYINCTAAMAALILSSLYFILSNFLVSSDIINAETVKKKKKIGFINGLKHVFQSKYIGLITLLILCYGISINLIEGVWKAQARLVYSNTQSYSSFMADIQGYTGYASMIAMAFGSYIMTKISWRFAALITPIMIIITGFIFFGYAIFEQEITTLLPFIATLPVIITAVSVGSLQNILSKGAKYAFFDASKEIAYIPLDESLKSKGKAAADVIGGRLGKSGGALITWALLLAPGTSLIDISPKLAIIFGLIMMVWFVAVNILANEFYKISGNKS